MKTILCYGDSNTHGYNPASQDRFPPDVRWTGVLVCELGTGYRVIEEGLNGRTTVWEDPIEEGRCGKTYLGPCLLSHQPIDLVVLMLGTNDLKRRFAAPVGDIARGISMLINMIQWSETGPEGRPPRVLLMSPPPLTRLSEYSDTFGREGVEKSKLLAGAFRLAAEEYGCDFLDAGQVIEASDIDGLHFEADAHHRLGLAVAARIRALFSG